MKCPPKTFSGRHYKGMALSIAAGIVALPQTRHNSHMSDPADAGEHFVQVNGEYP
jgi:hypothetical protein